MAHTNSPWPCEPQGRVVGPCYFNHRKNKKTMSVLLYLLSPLPVCLSSIILGSPTPKQQWLPPLCSSTLRLRGDVCCWPKVVYSLWPTQTLLFNHRKTKKTKQCRCWAPPPLHRLPVVRLLGASNPRAAVQGCLDVPRHGEIHIPRFVIPLQLDATVESPVQSSATS